MKMVAVQTRCIHTVLVVGDNQGGVDFLCRAIGKEFPVLSATNGEEAVRIGRCARPDAIVQDVTIPGRMAGLDAYSAWLRDAGTRKIPVLIISEGGQATGTGFDAEENRQYLEQPPTTVLNKPISVPQLMAIVRNVLPTEMPAMRGLAQTPHPPIAIAARYFSRLKRVGLILLMGCAVRVEAQEGQALQKVEVGWVRSEEHQMRPETAPGTDKTRAVVHREHSKLNTQDADPLGAGAWQLQFNFGYSRSTRRWDSSGKAERRGRAYEWSNQEVLTYGVSDDLDLGIGVGYAGLDDDDTGLRSAQGLSDVAVSGKWRFFDTKGAGIAFAYVPTLTIPTGKTAAADRLGTSQEYWSLDTRFAAVKDWSNRWSANADIGYVAAFGERGDYRGSFSANGAVGYLLLPRLQPEAELNYSHDFIHDDRDADLLAVTIGAGMPVSDRVCVRAGVRRGIAGRNADRATTILFSVDMNF